MGIRNPWGKRRDEFITVNTVASSKTPAEMEQDRVRCVRAAVGVALAVSDDDSTRAFEIGMDVVPEERWMFVLTLASLLVDTCEDLAKMMGMTKREYLERFALAGLNLESN